MSREDLHIGDRFRGLHPADAPWIYEIKGFETERIGEFAQCVATAVKPDKDYPEDSYRNKHEVGIACELLTGGVFYEKIQ